MHYTLHQLRIFLKVADCLSITKAAEEMHLTQPAISIQLKKLQDQFELPLTEVIGRQLYITDFGEQIASASRRILAEADDIKYTVDRYKGLLSGKIKISTASTGKYVIPYFLKSFMDLYPSVEISIDVSNKTKVVEGIRKNESDFSLVSVVPDDIPLHSVELLKNHLYLVGSTAYGNEIRTHNDLKKQTLIFREKGSATRLAMTQFLEKYDIPISKSIELVSNEAVKQAVNAGLGVSIMPLIGLRNELASGTVQIHPIKGLPTITNWNLVYNVGKKLIPAQIELIQYIENHKAELVDEHFSWARQYY